MDDVRALKDDFDKYVHLFGEKYKLYVIGALHSIAGAKDNGIRFNKENPRGVVPDPCWWNYKCKLYIFEEDFAKVCEIVKFLALEDNANYRLVRFLTFSHSFHRKLRLKTNSTWREIFF